MKYGKQLKKVLEILRESNVGVMKVDMIANMWTQINEKAVLTIANPKGVSQVQVICDLTKIDTEKELHVYRRNFYRQSKIHKLTLKELLKYKYNSNDSLELR